MSFIGQSTAARAGARPYRAGEVARSYHSCRVYQRFNSNQKQRPSCRFFFRLERFGKRPYYRDSPLKKHRTIRRSPSCRFDRKPPLTGNSNRLTDTLRGGTISPGKSLRRISTEPGTCNQKSGQLAVNFNSVRVSVVTMTSISYIGISRAGLSSSSVSRNFSSALWSVDNLSHEGDCLDVIT